MLLGHHGTAGGTLALTIDEISKHADMQTYPKSILAVIIVPQVANMILIKHLLMSIKRAKVLGRTLTIRSTGMTG